MIAGRATGCFVENRCCSRYHLRLPVLFSWTKYSRRQNAGFTRNIGVGGAFVFAQICPAVGTLIKVELILPVSEESGREIRLCCAGKVIRVEHDGFAVAGDFGQDQYSQMVNA